MWNVYIFHKPTHILVGSAYARFSTKVEADKYARRFRRMGYSARIIYLKDYINETI